MDNGAETTTPRSFAEAVTGVNMVESSAQMGMPVNSSTSAQQIIHTDQGLVNKERVRIMQQEHMSPDAPAIKSISTN